MEKQKKTTTFISDLEKKQKRKREDEMGGEKGKRKNGKSGAEWLLSGGPIGKGAEQREDKDFCPVDDKEDLR